jgi:hypothetical protein
MHARIGLVIVLSGATFGWAACGQRRTITPTSTSGSDVQGSAQTDAAVQMPAGCEQVWSTTPLAGPWWTPESPGPCQEHPSHTPPAMLDTCEPTFDGVTGDFRYCRAPVPGAVYCSGGGPGRDGIMNQLCTRDADCPAGMTCGDGIDGADAENPNICYQQCGSNADCARCDMRCNERGRCGQVEIPTTPCVADCECQHATGGDTCEMGWCRYRGRPPAGLCDLPGDSAAECACHGGTCDSRHCCVLPDGTIATLGSPACSP